MRRGIYTGITGLISVGFLLLGAFVFSGSYMRLGVAFRDFGVSIAYYFCEIFGNGGITPTVNQPILSALPTATLSTGELNMRGEEQADVLRYFTLLFQAENFRGWWWEVAEFLTGLLTTLIIIVPTLLLVYYVFRKLYLKGNCHYNRDTFPLRCYRAVVNKVILPVARFIRGYREYLSSHGWIWKWWIVIWVFHLNLATVAVAFLAYYFYFAVSLDIGSIYLQVCKLVTDLSVAFRVFPWWILLPLGCFLFHRWRVKIACMRLRHYEARNCGFIKELPIVSMTCGSMGKKKTTMITDMALSQEVMFRQQAWEIIKKNDMKFPRFPWILFERRMQEEMGKGNVYNLATTKSWVRELESEFERTGEILRYDYVSYGLFFNDGLTEYTLFDVLETYAQAYFIYIVSGSLIVSNYSIRTDNELYDCGNFPIWLTDFFASTCRESTHSKILDFDMLRLGKKVIENNPNAGSFEFGVVVISEVGKERGNNLELKEVKREWETANQKNDLFNSWLKMCRHSATVGNFPFIKVFTDEQRPESWGADARDLCDVVNIVSSSDERLALPFYGIENDISEWLSERFLSLYYDFRFRRGDNTLFLHILKGITAFFWERNVRIRQKYGYCVLNLTKERGTMTGKTKRQKYFIMNYKTYRKRFSTDCFSDYFHDLARKSGRGIGDYPEYQTERASVEELKLQNSYFINSLYKRGGDE